MATSKKSAASQTKSEEEPEAPAAPASTEFVSHIKGDGTPTQDDLNPAYAPPKDEGAQAEADEDDGK